MRDRKIQVAAVMIPFIFLLFFLSVQESSAEFTSREYPYTYKSPRAMAMGGVAVAIGGRVDSLFYNPAGLSRMPVGNWEFNLLGLNGEVGQNVLDFVNDIQDAFDTGNIDNDADGDSDDDKMRAVNDVLAKFRGDNMHILLSDLTLTGKNYGSTAFGVAGFSGFRLDAMTHQGFGSNGFLEMDVDVKYGGAFGLSHNIRSVDGLSLGLGVKFFKTEALKKTFTAREMVDKQNDLENYIMNDLKKSSTSIGFDLGGIYSFARESWYRPAFGLSLMNIGGLHFEGRESTPMTVNIGIAATPDIKTFESFTFGLDYIDLFNSYKQDNNIGKRIRLGTELELFNKLLASMALRFGFYQGYPSYGAELRLLIFRISYVAYSEEIGAYAGQEADKRQLVMLKVGW